MSNQRHGGVVIGRFMPPHLGHTYLIEFARGFSRDLTVFVCTLSHEPIPGALRYEWMRKLFPDVTVVHITEEIPQAARGEAGAHAIWAHAIRSRMDHDPEYVFASESYGLDLARELGARFVPVDPQRDAFPVSAGMVRDDPFAHWRFIPGAVRPYFARKIVVSGSTTARLVADRYATLTATDYARHHQELGYDAPAITEASEVLRAQLANEAALLPHVNRFLVCDSDALRHSPTPPGGIADAIARLRGEFPHLIPELVVTDAPVEPWYAALCERVGWPVPRYADTSDRAVAFVDEWLAKRGRLEPREWLESPARPIDSSTR